MPQQNIEKYQQLAAEVKASDLPMQFAIWKTWALELADGVATLLHEVEQTYQLAERRRQDRAEALNVKSVEGLACSEWLMRTAKAEAERDAAKNERDQMRVILHDLAKALSAAADAGQAPFINS